MISDKNNEQYKMMFSDYPDIVTIAQLRKMLGISRGLQRTLLYLRLHMLLLTASQQC